MKMGNGNSFYCALRSIMHIPPYRAKSFSNAFAFRKTHSFPSEAYGRQRDICSPRRKGEAVSFHAPRSHIQSLIRNRPYDEGAMFSSFHEEFTVNRKQSLAASKKLNTFTLPAGDYEFPFEILLDGNLLETIVGPEHEYHSYEVYGVVERKWSRDIIVSQPLRLHKAFAPEPSDILVSDPTSIEGHWDDKVQYSISILESNIPFGSKFPVQFWLAPLSKGLQLGTIQIDILEQHNLKINAPAVYAGQFNLQYLTSTREHVIFSQRYNSTGEHVSIGSETFDVEWCTAKTVTLPQDLEVCTQRVNTKNIKIHHLIAFTIELKEESGSTSKIKGTIPVNVFMSPHVLDGNSVVHGSDIAELQQRHSSPPPLYNDHKCDMLLSSYLQVVDEVRTGDVIPPAGLSENSHFEHGEYECAPSYEAAIGTQRILVD
ncbi:hypothetical protein FE257_000595 [Aspergillus nanangensis]|uniref:Arrestin C-terminal-like domain-containing protein n=1 Tax=Aspergillus nanangensis TaxID=2582783 RepID=A0AAD4GQ96_ASPNN|nr:hypothetical protein FE257_000595 [Aspergillus nanangensis]